jgi:hypothetical protein
MNIRAKIMFSDLILCFVPVFMMAKEKHRHPSWPSSSSLLSHERCNACAAPTVISKVPFVIEKSGKYCVKRDLEYTGADVAIVVNVSNVSINFNNHSLFIDNPAATGILIMDQSEVAIENDSITYLVRSDVDGSSAIKVINSEKVSIDNLLIHNAFDGVFAQNSDDIRITRTRWTENFDTDVFTKACKNISIVDCTSANEHDDFAYSGMVFDEGTENVYLHNLNLYNTNILLIDGRNLVADNINTVIDSVIHPTIFPFIPSAIQLGHLTLWEQAVIKNCNLAVLLGEDAEISTTLNFAAIKGATVDNCVLENNSGAISSVLKVTDPSHRVRIANTVIQNSGATKLGVSISGVTNSQPTDVVIDNCDINGFILHNLFVTKSRSVVISNSNITDGEGDGVVFDNAVGCSILNNTISNNCGNGVTLGAGSSTNIVKANNVLNNGAGIIDNGTNNLLIDNVVFSNNLVCP